MEEICKENTYTVDISSVPKSNLTCFIFIEEDPLVWHKHLGNASFSLINTLRSKDLVKGLPSIRFQKEEIFYPCAKE